MEREFQINWPILVEEAVRRRRQLNLTQKQLASLAKVSTPTISRFEQAEKDVQLSSVLANLDILGMTDRRKLEFSDPAYSYDVGRGVTFWGEDGQRRVRCRISRAALDDHFSGQDRLRPETAVQKYRREIESLA